MYLEESFFWEGWRELLTEIYKKYIFTVRILFRVTKNYKLEYWIVHLFVHYNDYNFWVICSEIW